MRDKQSKDNARKIKSKKSLIIGIIVFLLLLGTTLIILLKPKILGFENVNIENFEINGNTSTPGELELETNTQKSENNITIGSTIQDLAKFTRVKETKFINEKVKIEETINNITDLKSYILENNTIPTLKISFTVDDANIDATGNELILALSQIIKETKQEKTINLIGYSCDLGTEKHNLILSEKRTKEVKKHFLQNVNYPIISDYKGESEFSLGKNIEDARTASRCVTISFQ